jgi:hypothetical protein
MPTNNQNPDRKQFDVVLHHEQFGRLGSGILYFGGNQWACVNLSILDNGPELRTDGTKFDLVKAVTNEGATFSLCDCEASGIALYANYVIDGDFNKAEFDSISVRYSDVSEWFLRGRTVEGSVGETLTWKRNPQDVDVTVRTDEEHFNLRSEYHASRSQQGEDLVIHEHVEFVFSAKTKQFGIADVQAKAHELSCLLSILLAYPTTIANVMVRSETGRFHRVHFPTFKRPERDEDGHSFWLQCFIQQPALDGRWQSIVDHYYQSKYRKICWIRLAGMQRYDGFWEYKALGYFSLLDRYLAIRFDGKKPSTSQPPAAKKVNKFRLHLTKELPALVDEQRDKIIEIATIAFSSDSLNFESKYRLAIAETDVDIIKIINLSDPDFALIKDVRNRVAHGDDHNLKQDQFPIVIRAESKIALLLTYWAFIDFGFTTKDFIECLERTHSKLKLSAMIDRIHMDRVTKTAEFFPISMEKLRQFRQIKRLRAYGCFIEHDNGDIAFSEEFTKKYSDWVHDRTKTSGIQDPEMIFGVKKEQARFIAQGYFESCDECLDAHHFWLIKQTSNLK